MALVDPQSVTIDGTAYSCPRITLDSGAGRTVYKTADGLVRFVVLQSNGKRKRSTVRVERTKVAADPLTAINSYQDASVHIVFDRPSVGFSNDELVKMMTGLTTALSSSTNALAQAVLGGQS